MITQLPLLYGSIIYNSVDSEIFSEISLYDATVTGGFMYIVAYTDSPTNSKLYKFNLSTLALDSSIILPAQYNSGISTDGTTLYIVSQTGALLKYTLALTLINNINIGGVPASVLYTSNSLYISFPLTNQVKKFDVNGSNTAIYNVGTSPDALTTNGSDIIVNANPVTKINIASGTVTTAPSQYDNLGTIRNNGDIYAHSSSVSNRIYKLDNSFNLITTGDTDFAIYMSYYDAITDLLYVVCNDFFIYVLNGNDLTIVKKIPVTYAGLIKHIVSDIIYYIHFVYNSTSTLHRVS